MEQDNNRFREFGGGAQYSMGNNGGGNGGNGGGGAGNGGGAGKGGGGNDNGGGAAGAAGEGARDPVAEFEGSSFGSGIDFLNDRIAEYSRESDEDREKRERRERQSMFLAGIADVLGNAHRAYSLRRGVKPMDLADVAAKARERIERARADRERENDRIMNYAVMLGNLKDKERDFNLKLAQAYLAQRNWREQFEASRSDRREDVAFRDKDFDTRNEQRKTQFEERKRQHMASERLQAASLAEQRRQHMASEAIQNRQLALSEEGNFTQFYVPDGGLIKIRNNALNAHNIAYVFGKTPSAGRPTGTIRRNGKVVPVTTDQMMEWIGENAGDRNVQQALRAIGGVKEKGRGY